jgi:hypothetical protein
MQSFLRSVAGHQVVHPQALAVEGCLLLLLLSSQKARGRPRSMKTCRPKTWRLGTMIWVRPRVVCDRARRP